MNFAALINQYKNSDQNKKVNWTFKIDMFVRSKTKKHLPNPRPQPQPKPNLNRNLKNRFSLKSLLSLD